MNGIMEKKLGVMYCWMEWKIEEQDRDGSPRSFKAEIGFIKNGQNPMWKVLK